MSNAALNRSTAAVRDAGTERNAPRIVGIDFDNTLVCYDDLFRRLAEERRLVAAPIQASKRTIRDQLRAAGQEAAWTELQALAYGERIHEAAAFPGARAFITQCRRAGVEVYVISHKTERPYAGGEADLRRAAHGWLVAQGFFDDGLEPEGVYFEATRAHKISRIAQLGCTHFVDDLAEFLAEPELRPELVRILFAPDGATAPGQTAEPQSRWRCARSWDEVSRIVLGGCG